MVTMTFLLQLQSKKATLGPDVPGGGAKGPQDSTGIGIIGGGDVIHPPWFAVKIVCNISPGTNPEELISTLNVINHGTGIIGENDIVFPEIIIPLMLFEFVEVITTGLLPEVSISIIKEHPVEPPELAIVTGKFFCP